MLTAHHTVAFLVLAATFGAAALAGLAYYRRREPRGIVTHLLALAQTLLIAQVGLGLLLLSDHRRAPQRLHYLYGTVSLLVIARIVFILAIAFFIFLVWRERREEISAWPLRARVVFYGAAVLAVSDLGANWYGGAHGLQVLAFIGVLVCCGFAMWRTWRDQHIYH